MDVNCCFSFITQQKCQVSWMHCALCEGGGGEDWHGFVMWAAADWRDRLPFDAQEVQ